MLPQRSTLEAREISSKVAILIQKIWRHILDVFSAHKRMEKPELILMLSTHNALLSLQTVDFFVFGVKKCIFSKL